MQNRDVQLRGSFANAVKDVQQDPGTIFCGSAVSVFAVIDGRADKTAQEEEMRRVDLDAVETGWYIADAENQTLRYRELERKVVGITATMLTKCLRELERDGFITRKQYSTIPPTVEYSLAERGRTLIPALESVYRWAEEQMKKEER